MIMELGEPCPFVNGGRGTGRCVILLAAHWPLRDLAPALAVQPGADAA
jgi:hypothetical protein